MKKFHVGMFIVTLLIPIFVGAVSAILTSKGMSAYGTMSKPPLSPPAWAFPVAWTLLYIAMGAASYFIFAAESDSPNRTLILILYAVQLAMNFMWSIIFFNWGMYLFAFIWLMIMWCLVIVCAVLSFRVCRISFWLFIPYILWLTFAAYLNLGSYLLSIKNS